MLEILIIFPGLLVPTILRNPWVMRRVPLTLTSCVSLISGYQYWKCLLKKMRETYKIKPKVIGRNIFEWQ